MIPVSTQYVLPKNMPSGYVTQPMKKGGRDMSGGWLNGKR